MKVAIIGAGPAGLAAAIELSRLPFVEYTVYEKAERVKEIGAGISVQPITWRLLEHLDAAKHLRAGVWFQPEDQHYVRHHNGKSGKLLSAHFQEQVPKNLFHVRCQRAELQNALLKANNQARIKTSKQLTKVSQLASGRVRIEFADGTTDEVDLVVGADGIRSVLRNHAFPSHKIAYTGRTAYRTLIPTHWVRQIPNLPVDAIIFWHQPKGEWVYTANLGGDVFELTTMTNEPLTQGEQQRVSWGEEAEVHRMADHFKDIQPFLQDLFALAPSVQRYAAFAGPRLPTVIAHDNIALIGDASHPLSGAFGAGAGFALEDAYALGRSLEWAQSHFSYHPVAEALQLFDHVRSPHYKRLYDVLDEFKAVGETLQDPNLHLTPEEEVAVVVATNWAGKHNWIKEYNITAEFPKFVTEADKKLGFIGLEAKVKGISGEARALL